MLKKTLIISILCAVLFASGYITRGYIGKPAETVNDTVTRVVTDVKWEPVYKVIQAPLFSRTLTEYVAVHDTLGNEVVLQREQKVYEDSTYHAVVSGVDPRLDSLTVNIKSVETIKEVTLTKYKTKHWHTGPSAGVFLTPKGLQPGIGWSVTYEF